MLDDEANIVRVSALAKVKAEEEAKERETEEVSANIKDRMEAELSERDREEF